MIEQVVLNDPSYVYWFLKQTPFEGARWVQTYMDDCVERFDALPFSGAKCSGQVEGAACTRPVTRFFLRRGSATPYFWCEQCDPEQLGGGGKLDVYTSYYDALRHVRTSTDRRREYCPHIIRQLAEAKGYEGNFTEAKTIRFLYGPDAKMICARLDEA